MQGTIEIDDWRVTTRKNRAGNLTLEVYLGDEMHAEIILQKNGTLDLGTKARPWPLGKKGWDMPGAVKDMRKFRFGPPS